jgi:hypothetical protein
VSVVDEEKRKREEKRSLYTVLKGEDATLKASTGARCLGLSKSTLVEVTPAILNNSKSALFNMEYFRNRP